MSRCGAFATTQALDIESTGRLVLAFGIAVPEMMRFT